MRWPVVGLVAMGLLVAINQVMLFMKSTDVALANEQMAKLKYENSELIKLYEENKHLLEENHELKLKETKLETDNRYLKEKETEMEKIKKQMEEKDIEITSLLKKVVDLPTPAPTSPPLPTIEQSLFDSLTAPNNVITDKDNLKVVLDTYNTFGKIRNTDKFQLEEGYIPIVIRAFKKHEYFQFVLEHYRNVQDINKTMMIISHDGIFPEMFKLVESIDFCQVKQVIYPHSGHVFTNRFPGPDTTIPDEKDQYNHPRPFPHVSIKHHYWWSMNYVWDGVLPSHNGSMIFNEDDHVPTWDYYITAKAVAKIKAQRCPDCWCIRMYGDKQKNREAHNIVLAYYLGNIAMIINRQEFEQFRAAGESFCKHDDYNWDWTIVQLKALDLLPKLSMVVTFSRAEHMGKCGSHVKSSSCEISEEDRRMVDDVDKDLRDKDGGNWTTYNFNSNPMDPPPAKFQGYGGWGHSYDHKLCMQNIIPRKEDKILEKKETTTPK